MVPSATLARAAMSDTRLLWNPRSAMTAMGASRMRWYLSPARAPFDAARAGALRSAERCAFFGFSAYRLCAIGLGLSTVLGLARRKQDNGDYVLDTHFADSPTRLSPSLRILRAALWSRPRVNPQCGHWWVRSWSCLATFWPQAEHICLVPRGFTPTAHLPASSAL